jgi:hypothetical protein
LDLSSSVSNFAMPAAETGPIHFQGV